MFVMMVSTLIAAQSVPASTPPAAPPAPATAAPDADKKVCRREVPLGSRMAKRICRTQAEWDADARDAQGVMNQNRTRQIN